jgi:hypothetical protein
VPNRAELRVISQLAADLTRQSKDPGEVTYHDYAAWWDAQYGGDLFPSANSPTQNSTTHAAPPFPVHDPGRSHNDPYCPPAAGTDWQRYVFRWLRT